MSTDRDSLSHPDELLITVHWSQETGVDKSNLQLWTGLGPVQDSNPFS